MEQELIELIKALSEDEMLYLYEFVKKLFGDL